MTSIREMIRRRFSAAQLLPPGAYHYQAPPEDPRNFRLHLRIEADGSGVLIVNAATVLHLNRTAAEFAYHLVQRTPEEQVIRSISSRYQVRRTQAQEDFRSFSDRLDTLISTPDLDPVSYLDFDRQEPYSGSLSAPYRLDCALTYRLPAGIDPQTAPTKRVTDELTTSEWEACITKAWQVGIPHIIFTGGEPTLRADLTDLIRHAEANGQVTGLLTDGLRLADIDYLNSLLATGLDHLLVTLYPDIPAAWTALANIVPADIFTAVHLTLTPQNSAGSAGLLARLAELGVRTVSLSAAPGLSAELQAARDQAASLNLSLVWDLPVPYSDQNPINLEIETTEQPPAQGAGRAWLYVEPDGDVLPAQGITRLLGNLYTDDWDTIWQKAQQV